ncbi:CDP-alcohol phosphatidyltransferase family protein [Myxococcota bacterium]|nr:CDP-alcohol phosphatidyltransferase family protein [Myxococcota bacterium]
MHIPRAYLPNALTLGNLLSGGAALLIISADGPLALAGLCVGLGLLCDLLDGRAARALGVSSPLGAQLDSLADLITFGVVPALALYQWRLREAGLLGLLAVAALLAAAAGRLARFNVEATAAKPIEATPQPARFKGLAVTLPALIALGAVSADLPLPASLVALCALGLAALMISAFPYRSFKDQPVTALLLPIAALCLLGISLTGRVAFGVGLTLAVGGALYALTGPAARLLRLASAHAHRR